MLFPQIIYNSKNTVNKKSSEFVMEIVAIVTVSKLLLFQVESFVLFIDYGHVVVM